MKEPKGSYSDNLDNAQEPLEVAAEEKIKQSEDEAIAMIFGMGISGLLEDVFPFDAFGLFNEDDWF